MENWDNFYKFTSIWGKNFSNGNVFMVDKLIDKNSLWDNKFEQIAVLDKNYLCNWKHFITVRFVIKFIAKGPSANNFKLNKKKTIQIIFN